MAINCSYATCSSSNLLTALIRNVENETVKAYNLYGKFNYFENINVTLLNICGILPFGKTEHDVEELNIRYSSHYPTLKFETFPVRIGDLYPRLKALNIVKCGLKEIKREDLAGLDELETLFVCDNQLTSLPSDLFRGKRNIKRISFRGNKLEAVSSKLLHPIVGDNLISVDFRDNTKISEYYKPGEADAISLEQLMHKIDAQCDQPEEERIPLISVDHKNEMVLGMIEVWKSGLFTDFAIVTKDQKVFKVHKAVMASQSEVFARILEVDMSEFTVPDFDSAVVEQFVGYLYTGEVPDRTHAMDLFALASKYDVPQLKSLCETIILDNVTAVNALEIFTLGHRYSSDEIMQKVFETVKLMFPRRCLKTLLTIQSMLKSYVDTEKLQAE